MFAKRFLYVAAAIMCLGLAYHLGATNAQGQAGGVTVTAADMEGGGSAVVTSNGDVYFGLYPSSGRGARWSRQGNIGANSVIVSLSMPDGNYVHALAANGNFYVSPDLGRNWAPMGNAFGSPVPTTPMSWGRLKESYR